MRDNHTHKAVGTLNAQTARRVGLKNRQLVTKGENFGLQGSTRSQT